MVFDFLLTNKLIRNLNYFLISIFDNENLKVENKGDNQEIKKESNEIQNINKYINFDLELYKEFMDKCDKLFINIMEINNLSFHHIYKKNLIKNEFQEYVGIYLNGCSNVEIEIIQFFKYFTNNLPLYTTLLKCNEFTTSEEISSFFYRSILCKNHICFCLARVELLSKENKTLLKEILCSENLNENIIKMKSCLLIMTQNLEDELCKFLYNFKFVKTKNIKEINKENIEDENIKIVFSDFSGVGKSTYIKSQVKNKYIYFPVGGVFTKEEILERFQKLDNEKNINNISDLLLHIDLYDTKQKSLMNDFLYFILVTKTFGNDNNIFHLSRNIKIYLEIPNSFIDMFEKFPILNLVQEKNKIKLELKKLPKMIISDDIYSDKRVVALFLKLLKEKNSLKEGVSILFKADNKIDKNQIMYPNSNPDLILKGEEFDYNKIIIRADDENKELTKEICENLIIEEIKKEIKVPNYYKINTFIKVLASQLILFNRNYYLSACTLIDLNKGTLEYCKVRSIIIKKFISLTSFFTKGAFSELIKEQNIAQKLIQKKIKESKKIENANNILENCKHEPISFENIENLALVLFHEGDDSNLFSIITNKLNDKIIYDALIALINSQIYINPNSNDNANINSDIKTYLLDYNSTELDFLKELKNILNLINPLSYENGENINNPLKSLKEITKDYVFTADNFIKMCLILIRIRAKIPIIMMGETGCGKTSLIKILSLLQNNGNKKCMKIDNIHAGHTNKDICNFIEKEVLPDAKKLADEETERKKNYTAGTEFEEKKLWVFFDELNTCNSMDLLSEIICKHSYQGKVLPENIVFIGAANPYRKSEQKNVGLKIKNNFYSQYSDLVYSVNPMPHSLLNFVFDFGSVNPKDEKNYIKKMIHNKIIEKNLNDFATDLIVIAQNYVRKKNGISSVSLREIRRFVIFYDFFLDYFYKKSKIIEQKSDEKYFSLITNKKDILSINLSIYLVYYLRLSDNSRKELSNELNIKFQDKISCDFIEIPLKEQDFIADNVKLDDTIARSGALLENLFSIFACVNKHVPIFIIGKPGSSKSLSVQIINNAMRGTQSKNNFFKLYKKLFLISYQGALNSTSEGVEKIFKKAREVLKSDDKDEIISTILFDEMGLAEHSPHNPLKVIHSNLEYDSNEEEDNEEKIERKKISFIGLSNWELDSAKMNRGITIRIPELNLDDIEKVSSIIAKSILGINYINVEYFFKNLGLSYYEYRQKFKSDRLKEFEDFHGNRDFYHLIKYSSVKINEEIGKSNNKKIILDFLINSGFNSLSRNFGGLEINEKRSGFDIIKEKFIEYNNKDNQNNTEEEFKNKEENFVIDIKDNIINNLTVFYPNYMSRYLLLITNSNIGIYLLYSFLKTNYKDVNYNIFIGSVFKDDIENEEYTSKILNKIKLKIDKKYILILKNLDSLYTSLYDLFNQNFVEINNKKYARIAVGSNINSSSEVNEQFRCIILVDQQNLQEQEIPFLNRFEKQILSFKFLMNKEYIAIANKIYTKCQNIIVYDKEKFKLFNYNINDLLINCDIEEICGIIYSNQDKKNIIDYESLLANKISVILPQDIILLLP